jgi:hypothetical protein
MLMRKTYLLLALLLCVSWPGYSQINMATLRGTVTDSSGAGVPGATVSIVEISTNILARRVTTDVNGNYEVPDLKPSSYRVSAEKVGFQRFVASSVLLDPQQVRRVDMGLSMGTVSETVTVEAGAQLIQTENGTISRQIDATKYTTMAVVDRSATPVSMLVTTPGMQGNGWNMVMSGIPSGNAQAWSMDGVDGTAGSGGGGSDTAQMDNPEFFETIEATTVNAAADASKAVGFNMASKHGANDFHGSVLWKEANSALGARKYFDPTNTPFILHAGAAEAGGHIIKNRTFFYGGWWHQVVPLGSWYLASVPTGQMRNGDFSQFLNPSTAPNGKATVLKDPQTGKPFPNNQIPASRLNDVSKKLLDYWPLPNVGGPNLFQQNNGRNDTYPAYKIDYIFARIDHQLTKNNSLFVRWLGKYNPGALVSGPSSQFDYAQQRIDAQWVASDTWVISEKLVNNFTFGYTSEHLKYGNEYAGVPTPLLGDEVVNKIGLQGVNPQGFHSIGFPNVGITGVGNVTTLSNTSGCSGGLGGLCSSNAINTYKDAVTWSKGKHVLNFGGEFERYGEYQGSINTAVYGNFSFNGTYTNISFADFLLGLPSSSTRLTDPVVNRNVHQYMSGLFVNDTFKLTPRLTLDYGLRWDFYGTPGYDDGLTYNLDPATGNIVVPQGTRSRVSPLFLATKIPVVEGEVTPSAKLSNFRPRISAAYRLSDKMVIRGGYGEFTETWGYGASGRLNAPLPFQLNESYNNTAGTPVFSFPNPFPANISNSVVPSQSATYLPKHTKEGVLRQYNLTLERQVGTFGLRASFVGMNGAGMNYSLNVNKPRASTTPFTTARRPLPQFNSVTEFRNDGSWRRQALQLEVQRRTGMLTLDSNFTWANNMENYYNTQDPYNVTNNWARDGNERRLYFTNMASLELPFGRGKRYLGTINRFSDAVIGGWTVHAIVTFTSGRYTSASFTGPDPANASPGNVTQLPDCVGDAYAGNRTHANWWNVNAFAAPPANAGRYGNCRINTLELYPIHNANMSISKRWTVTDRLHAMFALQAANVTNTPTFAAANTNISQANFGAFTSVFNYNEPEQDGYRQLDATLRISW